MIVLGDACPLIFLAGAAYSRLAALSFHHPDVKFALFR